MRITPSLHTTIHTLHILSSTTARLIAPASSHHLAAFSPTSVSSSLASSASAARFPLVPNRIAAAVPHPAPLHQMGLTSMFSSSSSNKDMSYPVQKTDSEWRAKLSPEQFRVIRQKGTEAPFTGALDNHFSDSKTETYNCVACDAPLYTAQHKFKSGCGWPAFFDAIPGAVTRHTDKTFGMSRTEIVCSKCGGHLGHVFKGEGYNTPTDERHCVNSVSINFGDSGPTEGDKANGSA